MATVCWMCIQEVPGLYMSRLLDTSYCFFFGGGGGLLFDNALKETMTASFQILASCIQSSSHFMPFCVVAEVVNNIN